jgi:hypothetical protein
MGIGRFSIVDIFQRGEDNEHCYWIQNFVGTLEEATERARIYHHPERGAIGAVTKEWSSPVPILDGPSYSKHGITPFLAIVQ